MIYRKGNRNKTVTRVKKSNNKNRVFLQIKDTIYTGNQNAGLLIIPKKSNVSANGESGIVKKKEKRGNNQFVITAANKKMLKNEITI